jgi:hypothetical protein
MREEHVKEDHVLHALQALAEYDRAQEAPPEVEARLLGAFQLRHARRGRFWPAIAATAAALVLTALWWVNRVPQPVGSAVQSVSQVPETARAAQVEMAAPVAKVARAPRKVVRRVAAVRQPEPHEVVTDFFPLMNPAPSFGRGQMLRVQLPAAAMQTVGLPVWEEHLDDLVQADVLVGEEGMPRAIRFVRFDVK